MANAAWNTGDRTNVTLTNVNLTATGTGAGGVRSTLSTTTGKYYWEVTTGTFASGNSGLGAANASATLSTMGAAPTNAAVIYGTGNVYVNNSLAGTGVGAINTPGTVVCIALDLALLLIWFRKGAGGAWSAGGNPATGASGYSVSSIFTASAAFGAVALGASGEAVTANFGDSAFAGVVPANFTSGFLGGDGGGASSQARALVLA